MIKRETRLKRCDRNGWTPGLVPEDEPDQVHWVDEATGLPCQLIRSDWETWCGYVGLKTSHFLYRVDYMRVPSELEVHGGLTYSGFLGADKDAEKVWWIGFDCHHSSDLAPRQYRSKLEIWDIMPGEEPNWSGKAVYRNQQYAETEVKRLAQQLYALKPTLEDKEA